MKRISGISLIALVITIVILLILAGITLNLTLGENGLIFMANKAKKDYEDAKNKENNGLENLYSSMMVATGDDAKITISMEDLNSLIEDKVEEKIGSNVLVSKEEYENLRTKVSKIRSGSASVGALNAYSGVFKTVTFKEPLDNNNYSVVLTNFESSTHFGFIEYSISGKTSTGFTIGAYNTFSEASGNMNVDYIVIPYTE